MNSLQHRTHEHNAGPTTARHPGLDTLDSQRTGRFQVDDVYEMPTGEVYFTDARRDFDSASGWVYSPNHPQHPQAAVTATSPLKISADPGTATN